MAQANQQEVTTIEHEPAAPTAGVRQVLDLVERAALNPEVQVDKLERLLAMQERVLAIQARRDATEAKMRVLARMPRIGRRGEIIIQDKQSREVRQRTPYAKWEDIDKVIRPLLREEGFTLTFRTDQSPTGGLLVTGVLTHSGPAGVHEETSTLPLPPDPSGSKNQVQAVGSAMSYGKRYTSTALLNIITEGEDDDGAGGADKVPEYLSHTQVAELRDLLAEQNANERRLCEAMKVERLEDLTTDLFERAKVKVYDRARAIGRARSARNPGEQG